MNCEQVPSIQGIWNIRAKSLEYKNREQKNININHPEKLNFKNIKIKQNGRFFKYYTLDRQPKLGVFEAVYLKGKFKGWVGHLVDTKADNDNIIFNLTKINNEGVVKEFEITYTESGYGTKPNEEQHPRVEWGVARRAE
ncbi:Hypothetical protein HVR_LOCUS260 [uncultured virus]|nr:Hypothetical protein HVR_LOCUS260 [uncultured virus]